MDTLGVTDSSLLCAPFINPSPTLRALCTGGRGVLADTVLYLEVPYVSLDGSSKGVFDNWDQYPFPVTNRMPAAMSYCAGSSAWVPPSPEDLIQLWWKQYTHIRHRRTTSMENFLAPGSAVAI